MERIQVCLSWLDPARTCDLVLPDYASAQAAGMDVAAALERPLAVQPLEIALVPTGFAVQLPEGYEMQVRPRSGLAVKYGVTVINAPGTIDADYRGEVKVALINLSGKPFVIHRGDRIAQLVVAPVCQASLLLCDSLPETARGSGGFGSTGR